MKRRRSSINFSSASLQEEAAAEIREISGTLEAGPAESDAAAGDDC
jgi:hypothetical protein